MKKNNTGSWPVNEIILWTLICRGLGTIEITRRYSAPVTEVMELRIRLEL